MAPRVYVLALLPTVFFSVVATATIQRTVGFHTLWYKGDINLLISVGVVGSMLFGGASFGLIRAGACDRLRCETISSIPRSCM